MIYNKKRLIIISCLCALILISLSIYVFSRPPREYPETTIIKVEQDATVESVTRDLKEKGFVKSRGMLTLGFLIFGGGHTVLAGDYLLAYPESSWQLAKRMVEGRQNLEKTKITFPEGVNIYEMADILFRKLPGFEAPRFISLAYKEEGFLFPDTYYFLPNVNPEEVIRVMKREFYRKIESIEKEIETFMETNDKTLEEVVIMASILEEEARTTETRKTISGILWKRIEEGMPLQVDATFVYVNGKSTYSLTLDDLKIDSPYNTYKYKGLPKGAITNPGLDSILSAVTPIQTDYWFYLNDLAGNMHYAVTHDQHVLNKTKYIR
jgi:UPF0755 protein